MAHDEYLGDLFEFRAIWRLLEELGTEPTNIGHHRQDLWDIYLVTLSANYISRDALGKESLDISFKKTLDVFVKKWTNILKKSFLLDCINHKSDIVNISLVNNQSLTHPSLKSNKT